MNIAFHCASMIKKKQFKKENIDIHYINRLTNINGTKYRETNIFTTIHKITGEITKNIKIRNNDERKPRKTVSGQKQGVIF